MDIIVKGRHTGVSDRFRDQVTTKLARIERLDNKLIRVDVEVSKERNVRAADQRERVELTIHTRGPAIRAEASADDRFAALDIAMDKLEGRLRRLADRRKIHHGNHKQPSMAEITATMPDLAAPAPSKVEPAREEAEPEEDRLPEDKQYDDIVPIQMDGEGPLIVREKHHKAEPMTIDQALLEMELVGHDFYLFRDKESGLPSVVYNRRGYNYGVLRLVEP
ncbi:MULTISPECIES: ribosome hibernation-promoting factor, HPF/YfiA family [Nonomuraea]|uniref:Ribosome hibernation promoting factor n=2 Tax=Nonomuraea TaxID=83681 RepID=A0ABW1BRK5_9ACTN|nr:MULTISPECIES: ribosome-associated translation inhibitor RaiA [Nonomuraea]MDA0642054.1 ribosome-associated translation inhibitor RaiA [Nonomuraea ferruginea]TXK36139.1 ribosome-associated translation inhibitor RaiA [Nonomuraea sp. C10]TXK43423.1 ribosome-associated translation inhibitor RaiA [Nonomuraea sp. C10]